MGVKSKRLESSRGREGVVKFHVLALGARTIFGKLVKNCYANALKSYIVSKCVGNPSEEALAKCVQKDVLTAAEMEAIKGTLSSRLFFRRDAVIAAAGGVGLIGGAFLVPYVLTATGISTGGELSSLSVWSLKSIANFFNVMMGVPSVGAVIGGGAGYVITGIYGKGNLDAQNVINQAIDTKKPVIILDADPGTSVVDQLIAQVRN